MVKFTVPSDPENRVESAERGEVAERLKAAVLKTAER
jgi:hypothetical protein